MKRKRISFGKVNDVIPMPNLIENQLKSFKLFVDKGMGEVLSEFFPIVDHNGTFEMQYVSSEMGRPTISPQEAKIKNMTYSAPLKGTFRLINKTVGDIQEQEIFMGDFPYMTDQGTFIFNGIERVVVTQIVRSPGIYFSSELNNKGKYTYSGKLIPSRGAWITFEIDNKGIIWTKVDSGKKFPITILFKAIGIGDNEKILKIFNNNHFIIQTLEKDHTQTEEEALLELFKKVRPNDPPVVERARGYVDGLFFDNRKYDLAPVGRYKVNQKLNIRGRVLKRELAEKINGFEEGQIINDEMLKKMNVNEITVYSKDERKIKVTGNLQSESRVLDREDLIAAINYLINLENGIGEVDNIDHLSNRRVRLVGELLKNQFQIGISRVEKFVRERMNVNQNNIDSANETISINSLMHIRPLVAAMKEFLGSGQLSQFVDQINVLAELTNKRRLSALGPGGFSKDRAGVEVRDVHYSHYGKICPIETPEGFGVGLVVTMANFARINEYGFFETPYRKVIDGKVSEEVDYLTAFDEDKYYITQATEVNEQGLFKKPKLTVRYGKEYPIVKAEEVDYVDVSVKQITGIGASLIPFLEHDDANRAVMGANMQRQGVPLIKSEEPWVGTGIEAKVAQDTQASIIAKEAGYVKELTGEHIVMDYVKSGEKTYKLNKFMRSNANTCFNQIIRVTKGQKVKAGDVLTDSYSSNDGELALGRNVTVAFMPWEGYNFEDAILLSEKLVKEDIYTTIAITEYTIEVRETKLGPEELTIEIPNTGERQRRNLDEDGIVYEGTEVGSNDILVGKVTPKSTDEKSAQERLLEAIFNEKSKDVKDNSLRMPHGKEGTVMKVVRLTKDNADLQNGVIEQIKVFVAEKRKIREGDKMAGRHGNKGVISRILPVEDMPYLPDGTPVDVVLNPLGVPSRMNIGQIMETHLGMAAKMLGVKFATPVFDAASSEEISEKLKEAKLPDNGKFILTDGRTGNKFENPVTVGVMYMLKLNHQIKDKIHARSTGPYSLVTQQPLGGKAQMGGQRFGEMEVWALEAHGAAYTLQEMLTLKSDDVFGRAQLYEAIVKGKEFPKPSTTESFKVLLNEMRGLGLDVNGVTNEGKMIFKESEKQNKPKQEG